MASVLMAFALQTRAKEFHVSLMNTASKESAFLVLLTHAITLHVPMVDVLMEDVPQTLALVFIAKMESAMKENALINCVLVLIALMVRAKMVNVLLIHVMVSIA